MKYRSKLFEIEAVQFALGEYLELLEFAGDKVVLSRCPETDEPCAYIFTLEGVMKATLGDYIIKGMLGEFYPCKPEVFETKYEKMEEPK